MNNLILLKQSPNKNQHNFEDNIEKFPVLSVFSVIENQLTIGLFLEISETFMGIFILLQLEQFNPDKHRNNEAHEHENEQHNGENSHLIEIIITIDQKVDFSIRLSRNFLTNQKIQTSFQKSWLKEHKKRQAKTQRLSLRRLKSHCMPKHFNLNNNQIHQQNQPTQQKTQNLRIKDQLLSVLLVLQIKQALHRLRKLNRLIPEKAEN